MVSAKLEFKYESLKIKFKYKKNTENYPRKCFWTKENNTQIKIYLRVRLIGLRTTRPLTSTLTLALSNWTYFGEICSVDDQKTAVASSDTCRESCCKDFSFMFIIMVYFLPLETPSGTMSPLTTPIAPPPKPLTSRQQVAMELLQTERNYVEILTNILKVNETQFHNVLF